MKELTEMNPDELLTYCVEQKIHGATFREIASIFEKAEIDDENRRFIMDRLNALDRKQQEIHEQTEKSDQKKGGFMGIVLGMIIIAFGWILYTLTVSAGVIFILNFIIWGFGAMLLIRGLVTFTSGFIKSR